MREPSYTKRGRRIARSRELLEADIAKADKEGDTELAHALIELGETNGLLEPPKPPTERSTINEDIRRAAGRLAGEPSQG
jgi:hypothetical protein